jgi:hypothetical protein
MNLSFSLSAEPTKTTTSFSSSPTSSPSSFSSSSDFLHPTHQKRQYSSIYRGVHWSISSRMWIAQYKKNGKVIYIGSFHHEEQAAIAYDTYSSKQGNLRLNFSPSQIDENSQKNPFDSMDVFRKTKKSNSSPYRGVSWNQRQCKWRVQIQHAGIQHYIGTFQTEQEAALAYNTMAVKLKGKGAVINHVVYKEETMCAVVVSEGKLPSHKRQKRQENTRPSSSSPPAPPLKPPVRLRILPVQSSTCPDADDFFQQEMALIEHLTTQ